MVQLKVINSMVDNLGHFATEVTRVSRDGRQARRVENVEGTWRELTNEEVRSIAEVTTAVAKGDLSKQIRVSAKGEILNLKNTVNDMVLRLWTLAVEVMRVTLEVGNQGKLGGKAAVPDVEGIATVTTAVAQGDLSQKAGLDQHAEGEISTLKDTANRLADQLNAFASEVTRVALEVGTEGRLGGQAKVLGVLGTWKDLKDNVNVRSMQDLKGTINERLGKFSREVTCVALEVWTEGKLGGQAEVEGVQGTWRDLTDNVNVRMPPFSAPANWAIG
ncbi:hypothetical protein GGX14DRAFT_417593 [Mycena pura]|uniref:HAMP domain-containing protein n=1 Tax=Mycena pura TaxID=153505 RepID=A0AAD6YR13_9AGAR|nr:hypothetical protein GGX14DRAFT_417593 [Mycena pura]